MSPLPEQARRQDFVKSCYHGEDEMDVDVMVYNNRCATATTTKKKKYAMKHLSGKLLRRPKQFYQAALELSREV